MQYARGFFKEFVVNVDAPAARSRTLNRALRRVGIFGGQDLSAAFPELGQSALYCVTELHTRAHIDRLAGAIREWIRS